MPGRGGPPPASAAPDIAGMEPLLREHLALRRELTAALGRRLQEGKDPAEVTRLEEKCAGLLHRVLAHFGGLCFESMRRGIDPDLLGPVYEGIAGRGNALDPTTALDAGPGTGPDPASVAAWRAGARAGRASSRFLLGMALLFRPQGPAAVPEAVALLEKAAAEDYGPAALMLARVLESGESVPRDLPRSLELLRAAADLGMAEACWRLAMHHASGEGVPRDLPKAMELLERAAEAGHPEAQLELGRLRAVGGPDFEPDHAEALRWLAPAAGQHRALAREWLDRYGGMPPREYPNALWVEGWTPTELPPAPRSGLLGILLSLGILGLLVAAAAAGNSLGLFLLLLFVAVILHEAGHWLAARMAGIPILVFSVGVGPLVRSFPWGRDRLPMRIDLRLLPLMGSVQPYAAPRGIWEFWKERFRREDAGEPPPPVPEFDRKEEPQPVFHFVPRPRRLGFLLGGLAVNLLLAVGCLWAYEQGSERARLWTAPVAGPVPAGSLAEAAGIREGDRFVSVDGRPVRGFFEVQRRLAPEDASGAAGPLADPPGRRVPLVVRRGEAEVVLEWTTPAAPPAGDAKGAFGLRPPETWTIAAVHGDAAPGLLPGDEIVAFEGRSGPVEVTDPGARGLLESSFSGSPLGPVEVSFRRKGLPRRVTINPTFGPDARGPGEGGGRPPFSFERVREVGPPRGLGEVVGRVFAFGWESVIGLPRAMVAAIGSKPTPEEQGALLEAVRRDPWAGVRTFALMNAFLLFLNLVPLPPLDGFQILCCLLEMAARRPLPKGGMGLALRAGWILMGLWLVLNVVLILRDLGSSVF